jgi:hypothetical protein
LTCCAVVGSSPNWSEFTALWDTTWAGGAKGQGVLEMELLVEQQQQQIHQLLAEQAALRQQADLCQQQVAEFEQLAKVAEAAAAHWRAEATEVSQPLQLIVEQAPVSWQALFSSSSDLQSCSLSSMAGIFVVAT